jgi:hypothetical protein
LVALGLFCGYILHQPDRTARSYNRQIDSLSSQVSDMKQVMMLSLLQDPSFLLEEQKKRTIINFIIFDL